MPRIIYLYLLQLLCSKMCRRKPVPEFTDEELVDAQLSGRCCQAEVKEVQRMRWCCCAKSKEDENDDKLQRVLGCPELTLLSVAMTLGTAGVFVIPGLAVEKAGPGVVRCRGWADLRVQHSIVNFESTNDVIFALCLRFFRL